MKKVHKICMVIIFLLVLICNCDFVYALERSDFEITLKSKGAITFGSLGINGNGIPWGTEKFVMTIDDDTTEYLVYCLNNDLDSPYHLFNKRIKDFDKIYNNENIKKILYYGFGGAGYDEADKNKVMNDPEYKIWIPLGKYNSGPEEWVADAWPDDLVYTLTHLALSYSYYRDALNLDEETAKARAFYMVAECVGDYCSADSTRAQSVVMLWYNALIAKPYPGIELSSKHNNSITTANSTKNNSLSLDYNEEVTVGGFGGKIEYIVPKNTQSIVTGNVNGLTSAGVYDEGTKITLSSGQSFSFIPTNNGEVLENLHIDFYDNYNVVKVDGGVDENGNQYQDLAGLYPSGDLSLSIDLKFTGIGNENVKVPNTASNNSIYFYIIGLLMLIFGGVLISNNLKSTKR